MSVVDSNFDKMKRYNLEELHGVGEDQEKEPIKAE
jgi:hypothetical protein